MPGKVTAEDLLSQVFSRTGEEDPAVLQGPAVGEDAAAIDVPEGTLVVSSDPISLAASHIGTLGVAVACNDVAVSGVDPRWLTVVVLLPEEGLLEPIMRDIDAAASDAGVTVVGGHSEYVDALDRPVISLTAMGIGDFLPTGGAEPGDRVVVTTGAGIEGTAILAADFGQELGIDPALRERAEGFLSDVSVIPETRILREFATAMHDPTEGGIAAGLQELARASNVRLEVDRDAIPVRAETRALCDAAGVDPLRIFGSGAVVASVPERDVEAALNGLAEAGIEAASIGTVLAGDPALALDGVVLDEPIRDDLYPLWEAADSE